MRVKIIIITILALLLVIFAVQNTEVTVVKLWFWHVDMATAILIFVSFAIGLIIGLLIPSFVGKKRSGVKEELKQEAKPYPDQAHKIR